MEQITGSMLVASPSLSQMYPQAAHVSYFANSPLGCERLSSTNPFAAELHAQHWAISPNQGRPVISPVTCSAAWDAVPISTRIDSERSLSTNPFAAEMLAAERMAIEFAEPVTSMFRPTPALRTSRMAGGVAERPAVLPREPAMSHRALPVLPRARLAAQPTPSAEAGQRSLLRPAVTFACQAPGPDAPAAGSMPVHPAIPIYAPAVSFAAQNDPSRRGRAESTSNNRGDRPAVNYVQAETRHGFYDGPVHSTFPRVMGQYETLIPTTVNGTKVAGLWDTGANISLISVSLARRLNLKMGWASVNAAGITGDDLPVSGFVTAKIQIGRMWRRQRLHVVPDASQELVLGTDFLVKLPPVTYDYKRGTIRVGGALLSFWDSAQHLHEDALAHTAPTIAAVRRSKQRKRSRPKRRKLQVRTESCADLSDPSVVAYKVEPTSMTVCTNRRGTAFERPRPATNSTATTSSSAPAVQHAERFSTAEADREAMLQLQHVVKVCMLSDDRTLSPLHFCKNEPSENVGLALPDLACGSTKKS